jgi:predicted nuclease of predicted toxin-antitoxin system
LQNQFWSALLTTDLRLLLDECLQGQLADAIKQWGKVRSEWVCDVPGLRNRRVPDHELMQYAQKRKSILVTVEGRLDEHLFPICTHHGIIVFKATKRHELVKAQVFKKLMLCGQRALCKHAVTYLRSNEIVFRRKNKSGDLYDTTVKI